MEGLYPSLHEKFKNEDICPICMMMMGLSPKYSCANGHTVCHRCKPYYYACPTCKSPLDLEVRPVNNEGYHMPPPMHYMPHPYPPQYPPGNMPTAPFIDQERYDWAPPTPTEDQELKHCGFCHAGCEARFPEHLRQIHESRCQFRPNLEEEQLPTDLSYDEGILLDCRYQVVGCNVRLPEWRKKIHEETCIYKDRLESIEGIEDSFNQLSFEHGDPNELVECRFRKYGCMVRMPRRRKNIHEEKCNYHTDEDFYDEKNGYGDSNELVDCRFSRHGCQVKMPRRRKNTHEQKCNYRTDEDDYDQCPEPEQDPDERIPCMWAAQGCQVMPRACRKETHEEKCNYRLEHCAYRDYGCGVMVQPSRKHIHEMSCEYASYS